MTRVWPALHTSIRFRFNASEQQQFVCFLFGWKWTKCNAHGAILHHNLDRFAFSIFVFMDLRTLTPLPPPGCVMSFISLTFIKNFVTRGETLPMEWIAGKHTDAGQMISPAATAVNCGLPPLFMTVIKWLAVIRQLGVFLWSWKLCSLSSVMQRSSA